MCEISEQKDIDFKCKKCGKECGTAPIDDSGAICEDCCEDHDYEYDPDRQEHHCVHCDKLAPDDWFDLS